MTHHGTYIDGFAGPQSPQAPETWAANLVLEIHPPWFRHFYLYELDADKFQALEDLRQRHADRHVVPRHGDFNRLVDDLLASGQITEKEATFCLLDQQTFECHWTTVQKLARHKQGYKIELFYFLAQGWLDRAFENQKDKARLQWWWGGPGWQELRARRSWDRAVFMTDRFRRELGYASVKPWPIYGAEHGGPTMYYMIHATDHPEAPKLMDRAWLRRWPRAPRCGAKDTFSPISPGSFGAS